MADAHYAIHMTRMAERDIAETTAYLIRQSELQAAKDFINAVERVVESLETYPFRNHVPYELQDFPDSAIRESLAVSHRIIYRIRGDTIFVLFVAHCKRNIEEELLKRALRFDPLHVAPNEAG